MSLGQQKSNVFKKKSKPIVFKKRIPLHVKLHRLLQQGKNPVVTFYFEPRAINFSAKDSDNNLKELVRPTQVVSLNEQFIKDNKGRRRPTKQIARDIHDLCHDYGASMFVV